MQHKLEIWGGAQGKAAWHHKSIVLVQSCWSSSPPFKTPRWISL